MISEKRSQAARANGARSRGPVTAEGKAISARNAMRHDLLASSLVLRNEDQKTFEKLFYLLVRRFSPVDDIEMSAVEEMAAAHWRMRRVMAMEHAILDAGILAHLEKTPAEQSAAVFSDPANQTTLTLLQRYESRFQSMYNRALRSLNLLRKLPPQTLPPLADLAEEIQPNEPGEAAEPSQPEPNEPSEAAGPNEPKPPARSRRAEPILDPSTSPDLFPAARLSRQDLDFSPYSGDDDDDRLWTSLNLLP